MAGDARHHLSELYEQLRGWVLDPSTVSVTGPRHLGFGVLLRRGMCAWLDTCGRLTRGLEPQLPRPSSQPIFLPAPVRAQLAAVLATTLLTSSQGVMR